MKLFRYPDFLNESLEDINSICKKWGIVRGTSYSSSYNELINFYGFPEDGWEGEVDFRGNPVQEILDLFPRERRCEAIDWIVEFDVLYSTVVPFMYLEAVFERMNLPVPENNLKNYEII